MRVSERALCQFAADALAACGAAPEQANATAAALAWSDAIGQPTQGVWRLPVLCQRLRSGAINGAARPRVESRGPSLALVEGDGGSGHYVATVAMAHAILLARSAGSATVVARNSNYFGAGAFYVQQAASEGMLGLAMSNSFPKVLAYAGVRPVLGTNPIAFGAPRANGDTVLIDLATSESAGSTARRAQVSDPLLPLGGAKGYALALMVELLSGVVAGAGVASGVRSMYEDFTRSGNNGHFFWALNLEALLPPARYDAGIESLVGLLKASGENVLIPGERRWAAARESEAQGIALDDAATQAVRAVAIELGLSPPTWANG